MEFGPATWLTARGGSQLRDSAGFSPASQYAAIPGGHPNTVVKLLEDCIAPTALRQAEYYSRGTALNQKTVFDFAVVGGGLVGLATAWSVRTKFPDASILLMEKETDVASHQSGRNSGVLHSGIYYKPGSLKAQLVARGRALLLDFCDRNGIKYEICGKVILATNEDEIPPLESLATRGKENGLEIKILNEEEIKDVEPQAAGIKAVWVPETGIVDFIGVAKKLAASLDEQGVQIRLETKLVDLDDQGSDLRLVTDHGEVRTRFAVNCAGLFSDQLARKAGTNPQLRIIPFRGEYFMLKPEAKHLVKALIYPVADPRLPFLGVHLTRTTQGEVLVGPNAVLAFKREGYHAWDFKFRDALDWMTYPGFWKFIAANVRPGVGEILKAWSKPTFARAIQKLTPGITIGDLLSTRAGVRAQAVDTNGKLVDDFRFARSERWLHVLNAPSPAATACFAIGERIAEQIADAVN